MDVETLLKVAVLGSSRQDKGTESGQKAYAAGRTLAEHGAVVLTGGCAGLPHAAACGARASGGLTLAISPALNHASHVRDYGCPDDGAVILYTGMGTKGRNVILVRSADACLFVGGGMGTLNEFTIAYDELAADCVIAVLTGSGGLSDDLVRIAGKTDRACNAMLLTGPDPAALVVAMLEHLKKLRARS
jgi:uncharacterized protein (TIGR00725 family)